MTNNLTPPPTRKTVLQFISDRAGILALCVFVILCTGVALAHRTPRDKSDRSSVDAQTETRAVAPFTAITLESIADVHVTTGEQTSLRISAPSDILDEITTEVENGELVIGWKHHNNSFSDFDFDITVYITTPSLEELALQGVGNITVTGLREKELRVLLGGLGDIEIAGSVGIVDVALEGMGDIELRELSAQDADITISGMGDVTLTASGDFDGRISGMGDITCYGDPASVSERVSGIGDIDFRH